MKERKQFTLGHWEKNVLKENAGIKDETRNLAAWKRKKKKKKGVKVFFWLGPT